MRERKKEMDAMNGWDLQSDKAEYFETLENIEYAIHESGTEKVKAEASDYWPERLRQDEGRAVDREGDWRQDSGD